MYKSSKGEDWPYYQF